MKLINAQSIMSWKIVKESRTLHESEYILWNLGSKRFTVDDIVDPLLLLERLADQSNRLSRHLRMVSTERIVEVQQGYTVTQPGSNPISVALEVAINIINQAEQTQSGGDINLEPLAVKLVDTLNCIIQSGTVYEKECFAEVPLSPTTLALLKRSPSGESLVHLNRLLLEDVFPQELRASHKQLSRIVFVSHRWITREHPDPDGIQLQELQRRIEALKERDVSYDNALFFFDYSSMLQRPRTHAEDAEFFKEFESLRELSRTADCMVILSEGYSNYKNRSWCFFELTVAEREKIHLFEDQDHIKGDVAFSSGLMVNPQNLGVRGFVTSQKMGYKVVFAEIETIVIAFQHLSSCGSTHPEDVPRIRLELARHFNSRETTAFGRLVTAIAKFFNVSIVVTPLNGRDDSGPIECMPYFVDNDWQRLPVPGREQLSKFTVPPEVFPEFSSGYMPMLRLTMPGVSDYAKFLQRFSTIPNWRDCVVQPAEAANVHGTVGKEVDSFPKIDHVIHTVLERPLDFCWVHSAFML